MRPDILYAYSKTHCNAKPNLAATYQQHTSWKLPVPNVTLNTGDEGEMLKEGPVFRIMMRFLNDRMVPLGLD